MLLLTTNDLCLCGQEVSSKLSFSEKQQSQDVQVRGAAIALHLQFIALRAA
jgi:hypothetical protein